MPEIDVSDVLTDVDFADGLVPGTLVCVRTTQVMQPNGTPLATQELFNFVGVVTSDRGLLLNREMAGSRVEGSISVITRFRLQDGSQTKNLAADIVQWRDRQWTVVHVDPYTHYGVGFIQALCDLVPITG